MQSKISKYGDVDKLIIPNKLTAKNMKLLRQEEFNTEKCEVIHFSEEF